MCSLGLLGLCLGLGFRSRSFVCFSLGHDLGLAFGLGLVGLALGLDLCLGLFVSCVQKGYRVRARVRY